MDGRLKEKAKQGCNNQDYSPQVPVYRLILSTRNVKNIDKASSEKVDCQIKAHKKMLRFPAGMIYQLRREAAKEEKRDWNHVRRNFLNQFRVSGRNLDGLRMAGTI